jgi:outer membrane protein assembly factor BamB
MVAPSNSQGAIRQSVFQAFSITFVPFRFRIRVRYLQRHNPNYSLQFEEGVSPINRSPPGFIRISAVCQEPFMTATSVGQIRKKNHGSSGPLRLVFALLPLLLPAAAWAIPGPDDWPQWRGPNRDDICTETNLLESWPEGGPNQVWHTDIAGDGYSGFSIVGGRLYSMGADAENEFVLCLDADSGKEIWRQTIDKRYTNDWGDGPRSTPTINGDHAYALSSLGNVVCLALNDGSLVWSKRLTELGGSVPGWGYSESVLVDDDQVVCTPGGSEGAIVALDAGTGNVKWQSRLFTENAQYSSIIIADHPDKRHYVQLTDKAFAGIDPNNGDVLWRHDWRGRVAVIPTPLYHDKKVYVTSGYGAGSTLIDISDLANPAEIWFSNKMKNHHGGVIRFDGNFYGYSDGAGWVCQSEKDGELLWSEKDKLGKGAIGYADGHFYLVSEQTGEVALIDATPDGWNEKGRFTPGPQSGNRKPQGKIWVHPVIANGKLYLRDQEMIWCFDITSP